MLKASYNAYLLTERKEEKYELNYPECHLRCSSLTEMRQTQHVFIRVHLHCRYMIFIIEINLNGKKSLALMDDQCYFTTCKVSDIDTESSCTSLCTGRQHLSMTNMSAGIPFHPLDIFTEKRNWKEKYHRKHNNLLPVDSKNMRLNQRHRDVDFTREKFDVLQVDKYFFVFFFSYRTDKHKF